MEINPDVVSMNIKSPAAESTQVQQTPAETAAAPQAEKNIPQTQENVIKEILLANGFKASSENIKLAAALLEGLFPLNRENLQKLIQGVRILDLDISSGKIDEAMFFLKNNIPPTAKNAEILQNYINGSTKIMSQLENLMETIKSLPDAVLRENVLKALAGDLIQGKLAPQEGTAQPQTQTQSGQTQQTAQQAQTQPMPQNQSTQTQLMQAQPTQQMPIDSNAQLLAKINLPQSNPTQQLTVPAQASPAQAPQTEIQQPIAGQNINTAPQDASTRLQAQPQNVADNIQQQTARQPDGTPVPSAPETAVVKSTEHMPNTNTAGASEFQSQKQQTQTQAQNVAAESFLGKESSVIHDSKTAVLPLEEKLFAQIKQRLFFDPSGTSNKDVDEFLNRLRDSVETARVELMKSSLPESNKLARDLSYIKEGLEFVNQIKDNIYMQLPISIRDHESNSELLIFRDKKARKRPGDNSASALIALDTASLGRFEAYVQKTGKTITCQFRLRDEEVERLTRANIQRLQTMLQAKGYSLSDITYRKSDEKFTLIDKPFDEGVLAPHEKLAVDIRM